MKIGWSCGLLAVYESMIRKAGIQDLKAMIQIDMQVEGVIQSSMSEQQLNDHAKKIKRFVSDEDKGAFIYED
ncbi:hypothetical protein [Paenibacillus alvei]|uniref:hypothetical protein n=1 Tax=Paenibacillus alvei TaxID=44250 RepID=UPI00042207F6|nr:hypothetical protein [Paenibacillus alvei]